MSGAQPHSSLGSVGMYSVNEHDVPPMPQKPQGREGGTQQQQHVRAHETREQILEAFSKHSVRDALSVHHDARYSVEYSNMGGICMHARPDREVGSPAGALIHT